MKGYCVAVMAWVHPEKGPRAVVWSNNADLYEIGKARKYAAAEGHTVYLFPHTEGNPLERARSRVAKGVPGDETCRMSPTKFGQDEPGCPCLEELKANGTCRGTLWHGRQLWAYGMKDAYTPRFFVVCDELGLQVVRNWS